MIKKNINYKMSDNYKLYDYQINSVKKMSEMELSRKNIWNDPDGYEYKEYYNCGIFGNPVGSGKTLCMLNLIKNNIKPNIKILNKILL